MPQVYKYHWCSRPNHWAIYRDTTDQENWNKFSDLISHSLRQCVALRVCACWWRDMKGRHPFMLTKQDTCHYIWNPTWDVWEDNLLQ